MKTRFTFFFFAFSIWVQLLLAQSNVMVQTNHGAVEGFLQDEIRTFLGIPYAKPPVGDLRWREPQSPVGWDTTLLAQQFAPVCPQKNFIQGRSPDSAKTVGNEDCLYLNVWTPSTTGSKAVMVFIHGGGNQQGSASPLPDEFFIYDGKLLAERGDVVVVTLNYRLGSFGYLVHPAMSAEQGVPYAGNYGILDQILALKWVKDNIAQFGGDPNQVMIFGESAGAVNVSLHLISPLSEGLFAGALIQSGSPIPRAAADAEADGIEFVNQFGCTGSYEAQLACLRAIPADSITATLSSPLENGLVKLGWDPIIDGRIIPDEPFKLIERGDFNQVPVVLGSNADEMSLSSPPVVTPNQVRFLFDVYVPEAFEAEGLTLYPPGSTNLQARESYVQATTDAQFTAPARRLARAITNNQNEPVYRYFFSHALSGAGGAYLGAFHGNELAFIFQTIENSPYAQNTGLTLGDRAVAKWCLEYWTQFAKSGNPNKNGLPNWTAYATATDDYLEIKADPTSGQGLRTQKSDYWDRVRNSLTTDVEDVISTPNVPFEAKILPIGNGNFHVALTMSATAPVHITLFNTLGQVVAQIQKGQLSKGEHTFEIVNRAATKGIYWCRIQLGSTIRTLPLQCF